VIEIVAPHTGEKLGAVPTVTEKELIKSVVRARTAFSSWSSLGVHGRVRVLTKVRNHMVAHRSGLIDKLMLETGKVRGEALTEVSMMLESFRYYLNLSPKALADEDISPGLLKNKRAKVIYHPRGVVGIISPWNFPLDLSFGECIPALLAGNAVIVKPSEFTPLIVMEAQRLSIEAGLDPGLFQVVTGEGKTGAALVKHVDQITFTGSVKVGRLVAQTAAKRLIPCTLELGGKDPMVVLRDADLDRAAAGAVWGAFFNSGQMCMSVERVYVEDCIADRFISKVVEATRSLRQGVDGEYAKDVGSMTRIAQLDTIDAHVSDALERGAKVLTGGQRAPGLRESFYEPTVLVGVDHSMLIMKDESFGPVLPIMRVRNVNEAIRLANDSPYGLNSSVWSKDLQLARRVARQMEAGSVCINDVVVSYGIPELPFGGVKESGVGRRHGVVGLRKYAVQQSVAEDRFGLGREPHWLPYNPTTLRLAEKATALFAGLKGFLGR
jgi:succinate-semialdehyde dehydrogenase/glutarate-semialdehyde dehydrogenase